MIRTSVRSYANLTKLISASDMSHDQVCVKLFAFQKLINWGHFNAEKTHTASYVLSLFLIERWKARILFPLEFAQCKPHTSVHFRLFHLCTAIAGLWIYTLISENQGLEKSRSYSNLRKISGPANLDFFLGLHLEKKQGLQDLIFF